jgi:heme/copper-type cytochrome/quinol oxidase subunit 3
MFLVSRVAIFATLLATYILPPCHGPSETAPMTSLCPRAVSDGWLFVPVVAAQAASIKAAKTTRSNWAERFMVFLLFVGIRCLCHIYISHVVPTFFLKQHIDIAYYFLQTLTRGLSI